MRKITLTELYQAFLRKVLRKTFGFWQTFGFHITPNHFYQPVPDTRTLTNDIWDHESVLAGLDIQAQNCLELLNTFQLEFNKEYDVFPYDKSDIPYEYYFNNNDFRSVDGEILYCMIRYFKPRKIIEVGSGYSTYLSAKAILRNKELDNNYDAELIAIEPYPNEVLENGFRGLSRLIKKNVQDISLDFFKELNENDILFIDSSHVLKIGSDVYYEFLEILPQIKTGVIVHFHDIFMPSEYPKEWVIKGRRFWTEQYLLQAFMSFNDSFEILWAGNYMNINYSQKLASAFRSYKRGETLPGSFWIRRTK